MWEEQKATKKRLDRQILLLEMQQGIIKIRKSGK
jgi:hypothetical protein